MNPVRNTLRLASIFAIAAATTAQAFPVHAGDHVYRVDNPVYQQECGSCHVAYPPQLLSTYSWYAVMTGLEAHFGTDASLDRKQRGQIVAYLALNASERDTSAGGMPLLRITETRWFAKEHRKEIAAGAARREEVKSLANCDACHRGADRFDYAGRSLDVPGGRTR